MIEVFAIGPNRAKISEIGPIMTKYAYFDQKRVKQSKSSRQPNTPQECEKQSKQSNLVKKTLKIVKKNKSQQNDRIIIIGPIWAKMSEIGPIRTKYAYFDNKNE